MGKPRGRPCKVPREIIITAILKKKELILLPNNRIKSKLDQIWNSISAELDSKISGSTLYSMACQSDIRQKILSSKIDSDSSSSSVLRVSPIKKSKDSTSEVIKSGEDEAISFIVTAKKHEFIALLEERLYRRRDATRKKTYMRACKVLKPGLWQEWLTNKIWETTYLKCAFNFRNHKLNKDATAGSINGSCKCKSTLQCKIDASDEDVVNIECFVNKGFGVCGRRPLRAPTRHGIEEELYTESTDVYLAEKADKLMKLEDAKPPHLYRPSALSNDGLVDLTADSPQASKREDNAKTCVLCATDIPECPSVDRAKNLCAECMPIASAKKILSAREIEDRGVLASNEVRQRSRYLTRSCATSNATSHDKSSEIPIMRNANSPKLQATKFGTVKYSFANTCGFDSLMQVLLVAAYDKPYISEVVNARMTENPLFHLILYVMSKGLTAHAYRLRAKILRDLFQIDNSRSTETDCYVNCEVNISYLVTMLFANMPSIEETSVCNKGCVPRNKYIRVPSIRQATLTANSFSDVLSNHVTLKGPRNCPVKNCSGIETTTLSKSGPFVFFEIEDTQSIELSTIPLQFCDPMDRGKSFGLLGVVDLKAPMEDASSGGKYRKMAKLPMGHYTAVCLRPPTSWMEYDDLGGKVKKLSKRFRVYPGILIYAKKNEAMEA